MGDGEKAPLRLQFNPKVRLEFHGSTITSDAGLLPIRELDEALGLTEIAEDYLQESRAGRNIQHHLAPLLRQSIYSRLAGYDDTNDAQRLAQDPAMRIVVGWQGTERNAASTSEMGRFETELMTQENNLQGLAQMNAQWVERAIAHTPHRRVILDMDSSEVRYTASRRRQPTADTSDVFATTLSFCSTILGIVKQRRYDQATSTVPMVGKKSLILS
jgi:hypothetical protein